jgi:hypothetical protein
MSHIVTFYNYEDKNDDVDQEQQPLLRDEDNDGGKDNDVDDQKQPLRVVSLDPGFDLCDDKGIKKGIFKHIVSEDAIHYQKYVWIPASHEFSEDSIEQVLQILDIPPPTFFFHVDASSKLFGLDKEYAQGDLFPIDLNLEPTWTAEELPQALVKVESLKDKTQQITAVIGDVCVQVGGWILLDSPSQDNQISSFSPRAVTQENLVAVFNPHQDPSVEKAF